MSEMTHVWIDGGIQVPLHRHLLVVYRRVVDRYRFASFLAEGLRQGDLCVYLAPGPMQLEMSEVLDGLGIPVDGYRQRERLFFPNPASSREQIWDYARRVFDKAEKTQAPCVRWLEEISWVRPEQSTLDEYYKFDASLNYLVKHYPSLALCQCDLNLLESGPGLSPLVLHRHLVIGNDLVQDNPFYISPEKFVRMSAQERQAEIFRVLHDFRYDVDELLEALRGYGRLAYPEGDSKSHLRPTPPNVPPRGPAT